jgi:hypothetical protein
VQFELGSYEFRQAMLHSFLPTTPETIADRVPFSTEPAKRAAINSDGA